MQQHVKKKQKEQLLAQRNAINEQIKKENEKKEKEKQRQKELDKLKLQFADVMMAPNNYVDQYAIRFDTNNQNWSTNGTFCNGMFL